MIGFACVGLRLCHCLCVYVRGLICKSFQQLCCALQRGLAAPARESAKRPSTRSHAKLPSPLSLFVDLYVMFFVLVFTLIINAYATTPASVVVESGGSVTVKAGGTLEIGSSAVPVKSPPSPPPTQVSSTASPPPQVQVSSTASPPLTPPAAPTYKRLPNEAGNHGAILTCNSACCGQHNLCTTCASPAANDATTCQAWRRWRSHGHRECVRE